MPTKADLDNHANQLNPNNDAYYSSRNGGDSGDDDDDCGSTGAGWSYRAPSYSPTTRAPQKHLFRFAAVTLDGTVMRAELTFSCSPFFEYENAIKRAEEELLGKVNRLLKGVLAYYEVRDDKGVLLRVSRARPWTLHRHSGDVTEDVVRRMQRTMSYRSQATQAANQCSALVARCRAFCEALPSRPPAGYKRDSWQTLRDDLQARFSRSPEDVTHLDVHAASQALAGAGYPTDRMPSAEEMKSLARQSSVLAKASLHRTPPRDPNVLDCTGRAPDLYRDYFEESLAKYQLAQLIQWFDKGAPTVQRHLADVESGVELAYDRWLPLDVTNS